ncbi:hypothetical protein OGM63_26225 [Plectonema radiosum NIES-515]|uniref:Uncharacterized protein n=1 Tax=Plectonema radiosum NIES-515 TaxID=2986073 RepID=A0ABT3B6G2_9CYAN|nr:hypothetical protein [Plectonema radiosum]MCV3216961.1 hypothetical protein [Plectonema radiosum NIES-515]
MPPKLYVLALPYFFMLDILTYVMQSDVKDKIIRLGVKIKAIA